MNLLTINNRFPAIAIEDIPEITGYLKALMDLNDYLKLVTGYDPARRMVDSVEILAMISATGEAISRLSRETEGELILKRVK